MRPLLWILLLGAALRLVLWAASHGQPLHVWDERDYNALAVGLVQRGEFGYAPGERTSLRPPLYPTVVAGIYRLCGLENYQAVRLLQAVLSLATVVLVYRLGMAVYSRRAGLGAAGLCAFYPSLLGANNLLLTEVLFTFWLCAACLALVLSLQRGSVALLALAGVLLGLGALTRSVLWLFPVLLVLFLLLAWRGNLGRRALAAGALVAAFAVTLAPWTVRNTLLQQTFITVDTMGGRNFMMGNYRHTPLYRAWDAIAIEGEQSWAHEVHATYPPALRQTQGQVDKLALRQGLEFVRDNPGLTLGRAVVKFFQFWGLERELLAGALRGHYGAMPKPVLLLLTVVIFGSYAAALVAGVFGAVAARPAEWRVHVLLLLVVGFVCLVHTAVFGHSRYHLPLMPLVLIYAAAALARVPDMWRQRQRRAVWLAGAVAGVFVGGWLWEIVIVDLERFLGMIGGAV